MSASRRNARPLFIHVGTHKTGTTSIQAFLRDNTAALAARGVHVPHAGRGEDAAGHHNLTQELLADAHFAAERGGLAELAAELAASRLDRAVISSEDFALLARSPDALVRLRDAVVAAGFRPTIVVYLRPQAGYCVSIYAEIVKNGNRKRFDRYLTEIAAYGSFEWNGALGPSCRYDELLERFAGIFGSRSIVVRRYRAAARQDALLRDFVTVVAGRRVPFAAFVFPPERFNRSLSFGRVLAALGCDPGVIDMRFAPLDLRALARLVAPFWLANARVAARYRCWVPPVELQDLLLALPLRRTPTRTAGLRAARRALLACADADASTR